MNALIDLQSLKALPSIVARQTNLLEDNNPTPYYLSCFHAWFHNHPGGATGMLIQVRHSILRCEHCSGLWETNPDPDWIMRREKRIDEVITRLKPTSNPWTWECPELSRHDRSVYRITFDAQVSRWTCTCKDFRMFAHRFWGGCKHVRAVKKNITIFIADHKEHDDTTARQLVAAEKKAKEVTPSLDDELPVGRPIKGNGWRCTLLTKSKDGVTFLEVQGVIHQEPQEAIWEEFRQKKFEVSPDCVWIDIAHQMGLEVSA